MSLKDVVITQCTRTAIGRLGGSLINEEADLLATNVIQNLLKNSEIPLNIIDEVILGQAKQSADASNIARVASIRSGIPVEVPAYTLHRQCGSGLETINSAVQQIQSNNARVIIAGGAESMSTAPYYIRGARFGLKSGNGLLLDPNTESQPGSQPRELFGDIIMGQTAENLAEKYEISREEQDEFALRSQQKAKNAIEQGKFDDEISSYEINERKRSFIFDRDEHPRDTSIQQLAKLRTIFKENGTVTAGNSSGRNDGASALLIMDLQTAFKLGQKPKVRIVAQASAGVDPELMGIGPVPATLKALKKADLNIEDIDLFEINEAFSAQTLAVIKELKVDVNKVNPNGGAIALGHPIGATGAILMTKMINELERTGKKYGVVSLCIAGGMGISTIVENMNI